MKNMSAVILSVFFISSLLTACGSNEPKSRNSHSPYAIHESPHRSDQIGNVSSIDVVEVESRNSGGGAIIGALIGGVVGHQMGGGKGRNVTTGLGAVGGALAGNQIAKRNRKEHEIYRITVNLDNGKMQQFDYQDIDQLRVGDRVKIENGQIYQL